MVYFKFNLFREQPNRPFRSFVKRLFDFVEQNGVDRLVIDVRNNPGGKLEYIWPIVHGIIRSERINRRGNLFVIIGRGSASSAVSLCVAMQTHTNPVFVGEPTRGRPNGHADSSLVTLPNSTVQFRVASTWLRPSLPHDRRPCIYPDVSAPLTSSDYATNRDPCLEAIRSYKPLGSLVDFIGDLGKLKDSEALLERYQRFRAVPVNVWRDFKDDLSRIGYRLFIAGRPDDALVILRHVVHEYPWWANAYDNLAKCHLNRGEYVEAIANYERAFQLNPSNTNALETARRLRNER